MSRRRASSGKRLPRSLKRVFWNVDFDNLDPDWDVDAIIARVVEYGLIDDVRWLIDRYGRPRIHQFFREVGSPEISDRTVAFWRAVFKAEDEQWPRPAAWRRDSSAPWVR
jgi:hypothetical protein